MVRKLAAALLSVGVMVPGLVNALGLGEIKVRSALSEPLNADIEVLQARTLTPEEILVSLAGNAEFASQGIEKFPYLNDLRFEVEVRSGGKTFIHVTSRKPIKEPYVDFLIEVNWPQGRIVREMTMLLDPPVYKPAPAPVVKKASATSTSMRAAPSASPVKPVPASRTVSSGSEYGPTRSSDSLWAIAKRVQPSNRVSVHQTMLALQQMNTSAFVNGNINMLKRGEVLRIPDEQQILAIDARDAVRMVEEQTRAWRDRGTAARRDAPSAPAPVDTAGSSTRSAPVPVPAEEGKLVLVSSADGSGKGDSAQGGGGSSGGILRDKLAVAEEAADAAKLQTEELQAKVGDLVQMTEQTNAILKLKDDQIAALQARLSEMEAEMARIREERAAASQAAAAAPAAAPVESATQTTDTAPAVADSAATAVESPAVSAPVASTEVAPVDASATAQPEAAEPTPAPVDYNTATEPGVAVTDVQQAALLDSPVTPADSSATPETSVSLIDQISSSPLMLAGLGGGALALLAGLFFALRRNKPAPAPVRDARADIKLPPKPKAAKPAALSGTSTQAVPAAPAVESVPVAPVAEPTSASKDAFDSLSDNMFKQELTPVLGGSGSTETLSQTADVVGEADIYIAYGRFPQAVEMLERALTADASRLDVMLKLVEVAAESRDRELFDRYAPTLLATGDRAIAHKVSAFESQLPARELDLALDAVSDELSLDDAVIVPDTLSNELPPLEFDLGRPGEEAVSVAAAPAVVEDLPDLDFTPSQSAPVETLPDDAGDAGFEFDGGLESVAVETSTPVLPEMSDDVIELDFAGVEEEPPATVEPTTGAGVATSTDYAALDTGDLSFELEPAADVDAVDFAEAPVAAPAAYAVDDGDLQFSADGDEVATKLDLARAYIDMGDRDGARDILDEVLVEGSSSQKAEAKELLSRL
jgi:pilus assembly protein FimV